MPKLQRIMVDGGFTCPNRDGTTGCGGCSYCRNDSFAPDYCRQSDSITQQLEASKRFFGQRYKDMEYIAYFQSYSGTYSPVEILRRKYEEALSVKGVKGITIGTRPEIKIERYVSSALSDLIIAPRWGLKPYEIKQLIDL